MGSWLVTCNFTRSSSHSLVTIKLQIWNNPSTNSACCATNTFTRGAVKGSAVACIHGVIKQFAIHGAIKQLAIHGVIKQFAIHGAIKQLAIHGVIKQFAIHGVIKQFAIHGVIKQFAIHGVIKQFPHYIYFRQQHLISYYCCNLHNAVSCIQQAWWPCFCSRHCMIYTVWNLAKCILQFAWIMVDNIKCNIQLWK